MTRQFQTRSCVGVLAFFFYAFAVHADVVYLRDGQVLENVRTELRGGTLFVSPPDGAAQRIPVDRVLRIEPGPVRVPVTPGGLQSDPTQPTSLIPVRRLSAAPRSASRERAVVTDAARVPHKPALAASGSPPAETSGAPPVRVFEDATPVDRSAQDAAAAGDANAAAPPSRGRLFLEGLAPGWSGLHRRGDGVGYGGGALLGSLELYLAYHVVVFYQAPVQPLGGGVIQESAFYLESAAYTLAGPTLNAATPNLGTFLYFSNTLRISDLVRHPLDGNRWISSRDFQRIRRNYTSALAGTLLLDGALSAIFGMPQGEGGPALTPRYDGVDVAFTLQF
jgi:hypothetical protein